MSNKDRPTHFSDQQQERLREAVSRQRSDNHTPASGLDARDIHDSHADDYPNRSSYRNSQRSHYENTGNPDQDFYRGRSAADRDEFARERDDYATRTRRAAEAFDVDFGHTPAGPHTGRGPKNFQRRAERIQEDACERLEDHGDVDASEVEVEVADGILTLKGEVDSRKTKVAAEKCVESVRGVKDVMNHLSVNEGFFEKLKQVFTGDSDAT